MSVAAICIASDHQQVESIFSQLTCAGFPTTAVSVLAPDKRQSEGSALNTPAEDGISIAAGAGGMFGGAIGLLIGLGALVVPGVGALIAVGPVMAALTGAAVGASVGSLAGALVGVGIPEDEAKRFEGIVKDGGILISVHTANHREIAQAKAIFARAGARDIASAREPDVQNDTSGVPSVSAAKG